MPVRVEPRMTVFRNRGGQDFPHEFLRRLTDPSGLGFNSFFQANVFDVDLEHGFVAVGKLPES